MKIKGYCFITDSDLSVNGNISDVKNAIKAGVSIVQYREKCASSKKMYEEALVLRRICKRITFIVNDRIDVALACGADGVHIGQDDLPLDIARKILGKKKIIGVTVHTVKEAQTAEKSGADYLGVSPVFSTFTKNDAGKPVGVGMIKAIKNRVSIPIIAIGGINLANAKSVIDAGVDGLCAISCVVTKRDIKKEIEKLTILFERVSAEPRRVEKE